MCDVILERLKFNRSITCIHIQPNSRCVNSVSLVVLSMITVNSPVSRHPICLWCLTFEFLFRWVRNASVHPARNAATIKSVKALLMLVFIFNQHSHIQVGYISYTNHSKVNPNSSSVVCLLFSIVILTLILHPPSFL